MRIRPHHAPVHRKRLHLRIHTLLADLHITILIERHHRTVDLPLRTRRHLHIPELPHTPNHQTTPKQPDRQRISQSAPLQPQPNNNPCQCQCHLQHPTTSSKKPNTPHANDNTSSRTAHTPQKPAPMPQTSKSNAKPQAKAPAIHKPLINATANRPPPKYLSMKMHVLIHCPRSKAPCSKPLTNQRPH